MARSQIVMTVAPSGAGKTYIRGAVGVVELLRDTSATHCSSFPFGVVPSEHSNPPTYYGETFVDRICAKVAGLTGKSAEEYRERIKVIPREVLDTWATESSGPWDYFKQFESIDNWHIAIDEIHNYCGQHHTGKHRQKWMAWLGELRHSGATFEFLSQHPDKIAKELKNEAVRKFELVKSDERRDPLCKIEMADWYELRAGWLTRSYDSSTWLIEFRRVMGTWRQSSARKFNFVPEFFALFDSFDKPILNGHKGSGPQHVYLTLSRFALLRWFFRRNAWAVSSRLAIVAVIVYLVPMKGYRTAGAMMQKAMTAAIGSQTSHGQGKAGEAGKETGQPTLADPVQTAVDLRKRLNETEEALRVADERQKRAEALALQLSEKLQEAYTLVMMGSDHVVFSNGEVVRVQEKIEGGPYAGLFLTTIDFPKRRAFLSSGQALLLGAKPAVDVSALDAPPSVKPRSLVPGTLEAQQAGQQHRPVAARPLRFPTPQPDGLQVPVQAPVQPAPPSDEFARRRADLQSKVPGTNGSGPHPTTARKPFSSGVDLGNGYAAPNLPALPVQSDGFIRNR